MIALDAGNAALGESGNSDFQPFSFSGHKTGEAPVGAHSVHGYPGIAIDWGHANIGNLDCGRIATDAEIFDTELIPH